MNNIYTTVSITEFNLNKHYVFLNNDAIGNDVKNNGFWEKHITELLIGFLKPGYNCLDIGANFGYHTITMSLLVKDTGKIFAFEPMKLFYNQINANSNLNNLGNVFVYQNAVGNSKKEVYIKEPDILSNKIINHGDTSVSKVNTDQKVDMITIDSLDLPKINIIKLDVQGCELFVLQGAKNKILNDKPLMIVEIEDFQLKKFDCTPSQLIDFIKNDLGYDMYQMMTNYPVDFLCVPSNSNINLRFKNFFLRKI